MRLKLGHYLAVQKHFSETLVNVVKSNFTGDGVRLGNRSGFWGLTTPITAAGRGRSFLFLPRLTRELRGGNEYLDDCFFVDRTGTRCRYALNRVRHFGRAGRNRHR